MNTNESNESNDTPPVRPAKPEAKLACTVLVSGTRIGPALKGKGAPVRLPKSEAEALAALNPPRVRIDGV